MEVDNNMKFAIKCIAATLLIAMISSLMIGCNQTEDPTPGPVDTDTPTGEQTTAQPQPDTNPNEYGKFIRGEDAIAPEQLFAQDIEDSAATFGQGSDYSDEKLTNVYQITDYIANYKQYVEEYDLQDQLDKMYQETGFTLDMGFAAYMMKHYIDASGESYDFTDTMDELLLSTKIKGAQSTTINAAMIAAENLVKDGESGVTICQQTLMQFSSLKPSDGPAYYAFGNFNTTAHMTDVQRNGDTLSATVTFRILDFYDWSPHDKEPLFTDLLEDLNDTYRTLLNEMVDMPTLEGFCQADMAQLHNAGYAQSFISSGTVTYTVTWTAGQSFDQATVTAVNN